jgi:uncharacterized protein
MYFEQARQYALHRLENELSPGLVYHSLSHTCDEVVASAEMLGQMEGLDSELMGLLLTAAWFHDIGYVEQPLYHELISARIARTVLPEFGYTAGQIEIVDQAILATALPQNPASKLEQILTDADLDILGRENFMPRNQNLRRELAFLGKEFTDREWFSGQLKFVESHRYFTASARSLRDAQKQKNIASLQIALNSLMD